MAAGDGFSHIWPTLRVNLIKMAERILPERFTYLLNDNLAKDVVGGQARLLLGRAARGSHMHGRQTLDPATVMFEDLADFGKAAFWPLFLQRGSERWTSCSPRLELPS
jgi:hypothetical protein